MGRKPTNTRTLRKLKHYQAPAPLGNDSDVELSGDDHDFLEEYGAHAAFLTQLNTSLLALTGARQKYLVTENIPEELKVAASRKRKAQDATDIVNTAAKRRGRPDDDDLGGGDLDDDELDSLEQRRKDAFIKLVSREEEHVHRLPTKDHTGKLTFEAPTVKPPPPPKPLTDAEQAAKAEKTAKAEAKAVKKAEAKEAIAAQLIETMAASEKAAERPLTAQERLKLRLEELKQHREDLVHNAMAIMADPDNEIARLQAFEPLTPARDPQKLSVAFLTQCMVYRDIIPGYRIRIVTDAEREGKISKEVRRQRQYEETLLRHYQNFLKSLSVALDAPSSPPTLKHVVLTCLCNLLEHASHFNFRFNIISVLIAHACDPRYSHLRLGTTPGSTAEHVTATVTRSKTIKPVTKLLSQIVADALIHMFEEDHTGEISKEAIRIMADEGKRRHNRIPEPLIRATFHLRVRSEMPSALAILNQSREAEAERKRKEHEAERKKTGALHKSKRIKKHEKANSDINQELREADAVVHHEERLAHHRETLKYLFVIYFRIIKTQQESKLFPVVLEGLTMFAHLINIEFFSDIFAVLKKLLVTSESARTITASGGGERHDVDASPRIGLESRLFCVISMIKMLHIQGQALNEDPTQIITALYTITLDVMMQPNGQLVYRLQTMLLSALDLMFLSRRQNMADRLAAFIKRLASTAMQADAPVALGILALVRQLIIKYPALLALLEPDEEARVGMGGFQPEVDQPELANAFATSLWELVELTAHWHPIVGEYATQLLKQARAGSEALRQAGGAAPQRIAQSQLSLRAMPQHLQPTWDQMLVNYETCRATFSTFRLTPRFTLNAAQKRKLQRKGIWFGPAVTAEPSDFLSELKAQTES